MKYKHSGFILFIGLILFSLLAALILMQLDMLFWYRKSFHYTQMRQEHRISLERLLSELSAALPAVPHSFCVQKALPHPDDALRQLKSEKRCVYQKNTRFYYYWVEDLGVQSCLLVLAQGKYLSTHHWRVSVGSADDSLQMIQIQVAKPADQLLCDVDVSAARLIEWGIQSWRTV